MKKIKWRIIALSTLIGVNAALLCGCGIEVSSGTISDTTSGGTQSTLSDSTNDNNSEEIINKKMSIFRDKTISSGFKIYYMDSNRSYIDYGGTVDRADAQWGLNEEGSADQIDCNTQFTVENGFKVYKSGGGSKVLKVNNQTGSLYLELNSSADYKGAIRAEGQSWPHLLVTQNYQTDELPRLDAMKSLNLSINFDFIKFVDHMGNSANDTMHACQFQWYIAIKNINEQSEDYGDFFWFGLQFFDNRTMFCAQSLIVDGGKDTATGKAIYTVDMRNVLGRNFVETGKNYDVDYDIMPEIISALEQVKTFEGLNSLRNSSLSDLQLCHTNIGWEMPGEYDGAVRINSWDINYSEKK